MSFSLPRAERSRSNWPCIQQAYIYCTIHALIGSNMMALSCLGGTTNTPLEIANLPQAKVLLFSSHSHSLLLILTYWSLDSGQQHKIENPILFIPNSEVWSTPVMVTYSLLVWCWKLLFSALGPYGFASNVGTGYQTTKLSQSDLRDLLCCQFDQCLSAWLVPCLSNSFKL